MKPGTRVRVNRPFRFEGVNEEILTISVQTSVRGTTETDYIPVPLYLSGLGFMLPEFDFTLPGSYLPITHPDYYRDTGHGTSIIEDEEYKLSLDEAFNLTGKYYLLPVNGGNTQVAYAMLRTKKERDERVHESLGTMFDGALLEWILLDFILRNKDNDTFITRADTIIEAPHMPSRTKLFGFVQDPITRMEFEFPLKYLKQHA